MSNKDKFLYTNTNTMLIHYTKNDPKYDMLYTSKNHIFLTDRNVKIRKDNKNTKLHFFEFFIKSIQSGVKSVYEWGYRSNLHQFQCHTV